jgi:hypothetical protein
VVVLLLVVIPILVCAAVTLVVDGWERLRPPPDLSGFVPYGPTSIADEAQKWLESQ